LDGIRLHGNGRALCAGKQRNTDEKRRYGTCTYHKSSIRGNQKQLLKIDGIGPAKVEKFGEAILGLCAGIPP
jgi:hypothetical protein